MRTLNSVLLPRAGQWVARAGASALFTAALAYAADQPQWGMAGSRNMASPERGLPSVFDPTTGQNVKWSVELGTSTYSTPVVAQGRLLIGTNNGNPRLANHRGDRGVLLCLRESDGALLWQLTVPKLPHDPYLDCPGVGITSTAVVEENRVYIVSNRGEVLCLDLEGMTNGNQGPFLDEARHATPPEGSPVETGESDADILWVYDMPKEVGAYPHDSSNLSVLVHGEQLYVSTPNGVNHTHRHRPSPKAPGLVVLDKRTGRLLAKDDTRVAERIFHSTFSSPSLGTIRGKPMIIYGGADGICYGLEPLPSTASGSEPALLRTLWAFDTDPTAPKQSIHQYQGNKKESPSSIIGCPVVLGNRVYVVSGGDPWHGKREARLTCIKADLQGDITSQGTLWVSPLTQHSISTPAIAEGLIYVADFGRTIRCLDAETGQVCWTQETKDEVWGSVLVADGNVYAGSRRGDFYVLRADRKKELLHQLEFDDRLFGTPVAANGTLYVNTMSRLYAFATTRSK
jgi:outer membrane protein assembly factor BamB